MRTAKEVTILAFLDFLLTWLRCYTLLFENRNEKIYINKINQGFA